MTWCVDAASGVATGGGQQFHPPPRLHPCIANHTFYYVMFDVKRSFWTENLRFRNSSLPPPPLKTIQVTSLAQAPHFSTKMLKVQLPQAVTMKLGGPSGVHASPQKIPPLENVRATHFATVIHTVLLCQATCTYILIRSFRLKHPR